MNDGYYYFLPVLAEKPTAGEKHCDKSLGYISITNSPNRYGFSLQCALNKDKIITLADNRNPIELYMSPVTYITNTSFFVGKFSLSGKGRLFMDTYISHRHTFLDEENQYIIVTAGGRTLMYSELYVKKEDSVVAAPSESTASGEAFDPFNTTNPAYKWFIHFAQTYNELEKIFQNAQIRPEMFARIKTGNANFLPDTFTKTAFSALRVTGHILQGEYTDPLSGRQFTVIGLPGWNIRTRGKRVQTIRIYARWITALKRPAGAPTGNYNGYWLYYFERENGFPVKAVLKRN